MNTECRYCSMPMALPTMSPWQVGHVTRPVLAMVTWHTSHSRWPDPHWWIRLTRGITWHHITLHVAMVSSPRRQHVLEADRALGDRASGGCLGLASLHREHRGRGWWRLETSRHSLYLLGEDVALAPVAGSQCIHFDLVVTLQPRDLLLALQLQLAHFTALLLVEINQLIFQL